MVPGQTKRFVTDKQTYNNTTSHDPIYYQSGGEWSGRES